MSNDFLDSRIEEILERVAVAIESIAANQSATPQTFAQTQKMSSRTANLPEATCRKDGEQFVWDIPEGAPEGKCRDCQNTIVWVRSKRGKAVPLDPSGLSHMDSCPARTKPVASDKAPETPEGGDEKIDVPF